jgi:hypothetical protein
VNNRKNRSPNKQMLATMEAQTNRLICNSAGLEICTTCNKHDAQPPYKKCFCCRMEYERKKAERNHLIFKHYGMTCACCGESEMAFFEIDHINNDGARHRREVGRNIKGWLYKMGFPGGFQTLCSNCNGAKSDSNKCPHQECREYRQRMMSELLDQGTSPDELEAKVEYWAGMDGLGETYGLLKMRGKLEDGPRMPGMVS